MYICIYARYGEKLREVQVVWPQSHDDDAGGFKEAFKGPTFRYCYAWMAASSFRNSYEEGDKKKTKYLLRTQVGENWFIGKSRDSFQRGAKNVIYIKPVLWCRHQARGVSSPGSGRNR